MGNNCIKEKYDDCQPINERKSSKANDEDEFYYFSNLNKSNTTQIIIKEDDSKVTIEDFVLLKVLGKGSFGKVMLAEFKMTKQLYAIKVILKSQIITDRQRQHTKTERIILEQMHNEFMVKLHFAFQTEHKLYLVVDFMGGGELFFYLRKYIRFTEEVVQFYAAEILLAIEYMHKNKILYRDLKPENILLDEEGHVKLADFGLSKILEQGEKAYSLCGTPEYLAPEIITQAQKGGYQFQCDWWSFGAVIYEMLTGAPPFYSNNRKEILRRVLNYSVPIPEYLSDNARLLLQGLLVINPEKRLGAKSDSLEIRMHPFFKNINFKKVKAKQIKPPSQFQKQNSNFKFFDQSLIRGEAKDTPVLQQKQQQQVNFTNFTYQKIQTIQSVASQSNEEVLKGAATYQTSENASQIKLKKISETLYQSENDLYEESNSKLSIEQK